MKDLVPLENPNPAVLFSKGGLEALLLRIESEARSLVPDMTTDKGRKAIASVAASVARSKVYLDGIGKDYVATIKAKTLVIDAERRAMRDRLDALKDEIRQPLTAWEQEEKDRTDLLASRIAHLVIEVDPSASSGQIVEHIHALRKVEIDDSWEERIADAAKIKDAEMARLSGLLAIAELREQAQEKAEAERKDHERAEREAREARIAREAAEQATRAAEQAISAERNAQERARLEAIQARILAEQRAKIAEEESQSKAQEAAILERAKIESERTLAGKEEAARAADKEHKGMIHREILAAMTNMAIPEGQAKLIIGAMSRAKIPHVKIIY